MPFLQKTPTAGIIRSCKETTLFHKKCVRPSVLFLLLGLLLAACQQVAESPKPTSEFPAEVATSWFELQLELTRETPGFTPPVASRALGYSGVTLYESVVGGMLEYESLVG